MSPADLDRLRAHGARRYGDPRRRSGHRLFQLHYPRRRRPRRRAGGFHSALGDGGEVNDASHGFGTLPASSRFRVLRSDEDASRSKRSSEASSRHQSPSQIRWMPDGRLSFFFPASKEGRDLVVFDPATGEREILVGTAVLREAAPSPSEAGVDEREYTRRTRFGVPDYHWSPDGTRLLFTSTGRILVHDSRDADDDHHRSRETLRPRPEVLARWESDRVSLRARSLGRPGLRAARRSRSRSAVRTSFFMESSTGSTRRSSGVRSGYHWSPDSRHIAFLELDETLVPTYPLVDEVSRQATVDLQRYPKPGDPNPRVRVGFVSVATGTNRLDRSSRGVRAPHPVGGRNDRRRPAPEPRTGRARARSRRPGERPLAHRGHRKGSLLDQRERRSEFPGCAIGFYGPPSARGSGTSISSKKEPRALSPRVTGKSPRSRASISSEGSSISPRIATIRSARDLYRVKLDGSGLERLTNGKGTHAIDMNPKATAYLDDFSSMNDPGRTVLRSLERRARASVPRGEDRFRLRPRPVRVPASRRARRREGRPPRSPAEGARARPEVPPRGLRLRDARLRDHPRFLGRKPLSLSPVPGAAGLRRRADRRPHLGDSGPQIRRARRSQHRSCGGEGPRGRRRVPDVTALRGQRAHRGLGMERWRVHHDLST